MKSCTTWASAVGNGIYLPRLAVLEPHMLDLFATYDLKGRTMLDAGYGTGRFAHLAEVEGARVYGIDKCLEGLTGTRNAAADMQTLPFADNTFDGALAIMSLMQIEDLDDAINEIARTIKPNGLLLYAIKNPNGGNWEGDCFYPNARPVNELQEWRFHFANGTFHTEPYWNHSLPRYNTALRRHFSLYPAIEPQTPEVLVRTGKYAPYEFLIGAGTKQ